MNFMDMIKRDNSSTDVAFEELNSGMAEALDEGMAAEEAKIPESETVQALKIDDLPIALPVDAQEAEPRAAEIEAPEAARKLTAHTQSRLAALGSFDKLYRDAQTRLQEIDAKLSEVTTSQQLTRRFFNILQADIHRTNELELSSAALAAEHKKQSELLADTTKKLQEREALIESLRQREANLLQDNETLRASLAGVKMQLVETTALAAQHEAKLGDAVQALSAQTVEAQRSARESEVLREKQVSLSLDVDRLMKQEAEAQRKLDELAAIHANETARHSEILAALSKSEKEASRLQMALESAQMKQAEMAESALIIEADREAETTRNDAEMRSLRSEIQALQSRLETVSTERSEATGEIARLKAQLNDTLAEKQIADEKLSALLKENEIVQQDLSAASANISELILQQETEQIKLDIHRQECEDLRGEIAALNARIKDLLPFERLYKVTKARQHDGANGVVDLVPATVAKTRNSGRRTVSNNNTAA